ncbi:hypothetical protein C1645_818557 [Glomus cerebriforme]|uniref:BACK domain-containing protein n=1 Tax=Glomus cerebriforme TaxID=658196 RepID=A0A397TGG6_9GLOM|nr:hypothetical protein C1645_818557 [Glomus cerebriforme]
MYCGSFYYQKYYQTFKLLELTYRKKFFIKLWDYCIQESCNNPDYLLKSTKFLNLNPAILDIILNRDDISINNEITIWKNHPIIEQDINKWNKNDFTVMERRLGRFIPINRYYSISSEDFLLKIYYPFKELLPNDLINNIFKYHIVSKNKLNINMQPPRYPKFVYSTIIKSQHLNLFSRLIDKKENLYYNHKLTLNVTGSSK